MAKLPFVVSPAIAGKFEVINTESPLLYSRIGLVDFRNISLEKAVLLFESGSRYIKKVKKGNR